MPVGGPSVVGAVSDVTGRSKVVVGSEYDSDGLTERSAHVKVTDDIPDCRLLWSDSRLARIALIRTALLGSIKSAQSR